MTAIGTPLSTREFVVQRRARKAAMEPADMLPADPRSRTAEPPIYLPGARILCVSDLDVERFLQRGWHAPEGEYTWSKEIDAVLAFRLRSPSVAYECEMTLSPVPHGRPTVLEIYFNYFRICGVRLASKSTVSFQLPAQLFILPIAQLVLHTRELFSPSAEGLGEDHRMLGVALWEWVIS